MRLISRPEFWALGLLFVHPIWSYGYTFTLSSEGNALRWMGEKKYNLAGNPQGSSEVTSSQFFLSITRSLQKWSSASRGEARFDYWQGFDSGTYEPNSQYNGLSSIYYASRDNSGTLEVDPSIIALTQVWYDTDSGRIKEADIVLNDIHYNFTSDPQATTGMGGIYSAGGNRVFIENVMTHEVGHAYGLSHSANLQSSMLFMEGPDQSHLGCDDQAGILNAYQGAVAGSGELSGRVARPGGGWVKGAHVQFISRRRGTVLASVLSDSAGYYRVRSLEPGEYFVLVEPYYAGQSALSTGHFQIDSSVCGSFAFSRTFLRDGNDLVSVRVGAGQKSQVPTLQVECEVAGGASVESSNAFEWVNAYKIEEESGGFGVVDRLYSNQAKYYRISGVSGDLEVRALSYSLYSRIQTKLRLYSEEGQLVTTQAVQPVYSSESGYSNRDSFLRATSLSGGDYVLEVTSTSVGLSQFPAGSVGVDSGRFVMLAGEINPGSPSLSQVYAFNAKCRQTDTFGGYQSPGGDPPREGTGGFGFCGNIRLSQGDGGSPPRPPSLGARVSFGFPFLLMFLFYLMVRYQARLRPRPLVGSL